MVKRDELIDYINGIFGEDLLEKAKQKDELANGVQIIGKQDVKRTAFGVSLNEEFLQKAIKWGANFCVFHHGFDVRTCKSRFSESAQKRLRLIFQNDLTIAAYHYGLDAHPDIGNNALLLEELGADLDEPFFEEWGFTGIFPEPQSIEELEKECKKLFEHNVFAVVSGKKKISKVGVCSGGAKPREENVAEMVDEGIELFISGETSESSPHKMKENGISYFLCGHYATETLGIKKLMEYVKEEFEDQLEVKFIDVKNPI